MRISALFLLVFVGAVVAITYGARRARWSAPASDRRERGPSLTAAARTSPLEQRARRWVAAGLIDDAQARAIAEFEAVPRPAPVRSRVTPVVEAIAYVGGILLAVGAGMIVSRFWERLGTVGHLGGAVVVTALTGVLGGLVGEGDPVTWRLRGFLWTLSSAFAGAVAGLFVFDVLDRTGEPVALSVAITIAVASAAYWQLRDRPLQHVVTFIALVVTIAVAIGWGAPVAPAGWIGLSFWVLGAVWAALGWTRRIPPSVIGFLLGVVLTMVGSAVVGGRYDWLAPIVGLVTALIWSAIGIVADEVLALAPGVIGVFVFLPWTLVRFFGGSFGAPVVMMITGVLLLATVAVLLRRGGSIRARGTGRFRVAGQ